MRFLFFTDLHLEAGRAYSADRLADQEGTLDQIVEAALTHEVDHVLFGGDLYHRPHPSNSARHVFRRFARTLADAKIPMIAINGNLSHDLESSWKPTALELHASDWLRVSRRPDVFRLDGVAVCTLPSMPMHHLIAANDGGDRRGIFDAATDRLFTIAEGLYGDVPDGWASILMGHWACDWPGMPPQVHDHEPVLPLAALEAIGYPGGFDSILMGHIHIPAKIGNTISGGAPAHVSFGEEGLEHGCWILDVDGPGQVEASYVPLTDRRFVTASFDFTQEARSDGVTETDELAGAILSRRIDGDLEGAVLRVTYTATEEQHRRVDVAAVKRVAAEAGVHRVVEVTPEIIRGARTRSQGFDLSLGEHESLDAWCAINTVDAGKAAGLHEILSRSREQASARETVAAGAAFDPVSLEARNFGRFDELHLTFEDGAMVLLGGNGSGKSTVLRCFEMALYAEDGGALKPDLAPWADEMDVKLTFTLGGVPHRIRRSYRRRASGDGVATLDFERAIIEDDWQPLTCETAKETQRLIERSLGMSRKVFRASCFLEQDDAPAFLKAKPIDRKAMMGDILDPLGMWAADADYAKGLSKVSAAEITAAQTKSVGLSETVAMIPSTEASLVEAQGSQAAETLALTGAEQRLETSLGLLADNSAAAERVKTCESEHAAAEKEAQRLRSQVYEAKVAGESRVRVQEELAEAAALADRVPDLEFKAAELREQKARADAAIANRAALADKAKSLAADLERRTQAAEAQRVKAREVHEKAFALRDHPTDDQVCERCEQHLGSEARERAVASYLTESAEITAAVTAENTPLLELARETRAAQEAAEAASVPEVVDPAPVEAELAKAREAVTTRATLAAQMTVHAEKAATLPRLEQELAAATSSVGATQAILDLAKSAVGDTTALERGVTEARGAVEDLRRAVQQTNAVVVRLEEQLARQIAAREELAAITTAIARDQNTLDLSRLAERAFGRDGIPVLLVETVLPQIDSDANAILRRFPTADGWTFSVRFETQREQASVDRLKEELYVVVCAPDYEQDFRTLSGGETSRVSFAVRVALGMLLGRLRGAESRLLVLDELPFLDDIGEESLVELVRDLVNDRTFSKVLTVSHSPNVRDSFDTAVEIEKRDGCSTITATREPVAA